jgi:hypothetical protein
MKSNDDTPIDLNESEKPGVRTIVKEVAHAVREDLTSAQKEVKHKEVEAGVGIGMFGATGLFAFAGISALVVAMAGGFDTFLPLWAAGLVSAAILFALAGIFALVGKNRVKDALPPTPNKSIHDLKDDLKDIKNRATR